MEPDFQLSAEAWGRPQSFESQLRTSGWQKANQFAGFARDVLSDYVFEIQDYVARERGYRSEQTVLEDVDSHFQTDGSWNVFHGTPPLRREKIKLTSEPISPWHGDQQSGAEVNGIGYGNALAALGVDALTASRKIAQQPPHVNQQAAWNTYQQAMIPEAPKAFEPAPHPMSPLANTPPVLNALDWRVPQQSKRSAKKRKLPAHHEKSLHERLNPVKPKYNFEETVAQEVLNEWGWEALRDVATSPLPMSLIRPLTNLAKPTRSGSIGGKNHTWKGEFSIDKVPKNQPKLVVEDLNFLTAFSHWRFGKGEPVEVKMDKINWKKFNLYHSNPITKYLKQKLNEEKVILLDIKTSKNRVFKNVVLTPIKGTNEHLTYGDVTVDLKVLELKFFKYSSLYYVKGIITPSSKIKYLDFYDFNISNDSHRNEFFEAITRLVHYNQPGVPFKIYASGESMFEYIGILP